MKFYSFDFTSRKMKMNKTNKAKNKMAIKEITFFFFLRKIYIKRIWFHWN